MADLRPYQQEAVDAVLTAFEMHSSVLLVLPTGTGKTVVFATVAEALRPRGRVLVLAHREELIRQAAEKFAEWTELSVAVEMAEERAADSGADVVVASVQTLARPARLARFHPDDFGLVIVDEAHHVVAGTYRRIMSHFGAAKVLGVTATPDRLDGQGLGGIFSTRAFSYELRDAIEDGWLSPIRQRAVVVDGLDLSAVRTVAGDLSEGDLERVMTQEAPLHGIAAPLARFAGQRRSLVFASTVKHAHALADVLGRYVGPEAVAVLDGGSPRDVRRATLADFEAGRRQFLVNCLLFTEGFDCPGIECVAVARPTKSRALYAQMAGRGTRTAPGKRDVLILDFKGNAGRHTLVNTFDVLTAAKDPDVEQRAQARMNSDDRVTILDALADAEREIALERRRELVFGVKSRLVEIDPFAVLGLHVAPGRWGGLPVTDRQLAVLERNGVASPMDRGQAHALIQAIVSRTREGLCTYRQARTLLRYGYDPDSTFDDARELLDALARNGWRRPITSEAIA